MRLFSIALHSQFILVFFLLANVSPCRGAQTSLSTVTIRQLSEVYQGETGEFRITIAPEVPPGPVTLRLRCDVGMARAVFEDGSTEMVLERSGSVYVRGITSGDLPGALMLTAWLEGSRMPAATFFFDVVAPAPEPRIFLEGLDVTGTRQAAVVGQRILLTVVLHPSLPLQSQDWLIGNPGEYTGGFLHTPLHGGPQPVVRNGSTTQFYWVTPGYDRKVTYRLKLANGLSTTADVTFDVDGPIAAHVQVDTAKLVIVRTTPNSSLLGIQGPGISFHAGYYLPEGLSNNFTWVQLVRSDAITLDKDGARLHCVPKSQPVAGIGAGLDTDYPYDTHNPTLDNPRIQLTSDIPQYSRAFHARMYLLWGSGLSNSIPVPLGFVDWSFIGEVALKDTKTNSWVLRSGRGGPDDPAEPFTPSHAYPLWNSLVPYTEILTCN